MVSIDCYIGYLVRVVGLIICQFKFKKIKLLFVFSQLSTQRGSPDFDFNFTVRTRTE